MRATQFWVAESGADFKAGSGAVGYAHLTHYTAEYREWGFDGPTLVLIPGLAGGIDLLSPLAAALSKNFRVISYQLRGEGDCFALRRRFDLRDLASDLDEFLTAQRIESPAIMGVSFGGLIALEYGVRYPNRFEKIIAQGVGARFEKDIFKRIAGLVLSRIPLPADSPFINQFFNVLFGGPQDQNDPLFQFVTRQCWQTDQSVMAHRFQLAERFAPACRFRPLRSRAMLLSGARDVLVSSRSLNDLGAAIGDTRVVRMPHAGHLAAVTHPDAVAREVRKFLLDA